MSGLASALAILLTLVALAWAADLTREVGLQLYTEQALSGILAIALPLVYALIGIDGNRTTKFPPWYDVAFAVAGFASAAYITVNYPELAQLVAASPVDGLIAGTIMMVLVVEGLRRTVGLVLTVLVTCFILLGLLGHFIPGTLAGRQIDWQNLFYYLSWDPSGILGTPMRVVSTIVIAYVFFGQILAKSGGSSFFTEASMVLVGRYRGGQAKIAVTASGFFGSISGSVVSNVVTTGVITIPLMQRGGYRAVQAGAIEAVASTGGQLMPPIMGAAAFLMAEFLEIPYTDVVVAALIPAVLYYVALFILADLEAGRTNIKPMNKEDIPALMPILKDGWYFPLPFVVLIVALFGWNFSPEASALIASLVIIATGMLIGYKGKRLSLMDVLAAVRDTGTAVLDIVMIAAAAGVIIGVLDITGIGFGLSLVLVEMGSSNIFTLLLVSAGICIVLGMGMPTVAVYLLLVTLVVPPMIDVGIDRIAAHLFILYFGMMSMITPPVAIAAFAAATLTGADAMKTGFMAMRFGWFAYVVPFLFVMSPTLLMQGEWSAIILAAISAAGGVWLVSIAVIGYFLRSLSPVHRLLFGAAGLGLLMPASAFEGALITDIAGFVAGLLLITWELVASRKQRAAATTSPS